MRTRRALLLTYAVAVSSAIVASGAWAAAQPLPGADYVWAQPGTCLTGVTPAHEPVTSVAPSMLPCGGYVWGQLGASRVGVTTTQPV
jgi:hypothetical protein